jgi:hypothetical protein
MTAPTAAPKNIATTASTLLANLGLLPCAIEESAPMPVIVSVRTVVVRSEIASLRTAAFDFPLAGSATGLPCSAEMTRSVRSALYAGSVDYP